MGQQVARSTAEKQITEKMKAKREAWEKNPPILKTTHQIIHGDARKMEELGKKPFLHLVVTSPPVLDSKRIQWADHSSAAWPC